MTPATVTIGVVAVLVGLSAAYAARRYFEQQIVPPTGVELVVPTINLPPYARIREQDLTTIRVPAGRVPAGALTNSSQAIHRLVKQTVMAGEPIRDEHLYEVGKSPTLSEQLPPGHRAVSINVDARNALDGVLVPESLVDISLTVEGEHPELAGVATLTLMRRIKVLATNRDRFKTEERVGSPLRSITVAVNSEQANKLILAQRYGLLSVTLRSELDSQLAADEAVGDDLVNPHDLLGLGPAGLVQSQIWRGTGQEVVNFHDREIREAAAATAASRHGSPPATPAAASAPTASEETLPRSAALTGGATAG